MASSARIEELEKKFTENPRRYFAPLANEYRKAGDLEQAIAICRAYVPQQPAHMSGHVVFGQALFEAGQHDEAKGVLEAALALDPENLIALRHLGDIARARGELNVARGWYRRVLDADPRNEDVASLLKSLDNAPGTPGAPPSAPAPIASIQVDEFTNWAEINPERTLELPPGILDSISRDVNAPDAAVLIDVAPSIGAHPETSITLEQMLQPPADPRPGRTADSASGADEMAAATGGDATHGASAPPGDALDASPSDGLAGLEVMEFVPPAPSTTPPLADVIDPMLGHPAPSALAPQGPASTSPPADAAPVKAPPANAPAAGTRAASAPAPSAPGAGAAAPNVPVASPPAAFVTETMAELYLQQGFREEALEVYRQLLEQDPRDPTLRERVAQLEREMRPSGATAVPTTPPVPAAVPATVPAAVPGAMPAAVPSAVPAAVPSAVPAAMPAAVPPAAPSAVPAAAVAAVTEVVVDEVETPQEAPRRQTVRDFFGALATRRFGSPPSAEWPVDEPMSYPEAPDASPPVPPMAAPPPEALLEEPLEAAESDAEPPEAESDSADTAELEALSGFGFGTTPVGPTPRAFEFDVAAYDAADMSGRHRAAARPIDGTAGPGGAASESPAPAPPVAGATESQGSFRKPMQTGSVNVLFPGQSIPGPDEAAAATLSSAFGGPTQAGAPAGAAARPAMTELSLDSIFRDAAPAVEPRRESSAFSFDQFFGESPARAPATPATPRERPSGSVKDDDSGDAEQFSNWLSGLKKK